MINRIVISRAQSLPMALRYTNVRSYVFTGLFVMLNVLVPWVFHQFHLAGPTFLPMHLFVLVAGLLSGWRAGLIVGLLTPFVSYAVSGMPVLRILPQIVVELSAYGLIAGILRERFHLRAIWSLLGAMVGGRIALWVTVLIIYAVLGEIYSPLGAESNTFMVLWSVVKQGWPGIVIQLASLPLIIWLVEKFFSGDSTDEQT
jgi:hypothetical protein